MYIYSLIIKSPVRPVVKENHIEESEIKWQPGVYWPRTGRRGWELRFTGLRREEGGIPMERLERHELLALLNQKEMETLSSASGVVNLREGEKVYSEGMPASHFFVLLKGRVELRRPTKGGPSLLVEDLLNGSIFGVSSLTGTERYLLNAECVEDSEVLKVEGRVLRRILDDNPLVGYTIQRRVSQVFFKRYVYAMERLETIMQAMPLGRT